jgi:hypothetical protein
MRTIIPRQRQQGKQKTRGTAGKWLRMLYLSSLKPSS